MRALGNSPIREYVIFHFIMTDQRTGEVLDQSEDDDPAVEVIGKVDGEGERTGWPAKIENTLASMKPGTTRVITLTPAEGWGERDEDEVIEVDARMIPEADRVVGKVLEDLAIDEDQIIGTVREVTAAHVVIDCNHPMAGRFLKVELELHLRRAPTEIENMRADEGLDLDVAEV